MRLIDADDLKARAREEAVTMEEPWKSKFAILVEWLVDKTFTAYDVEAKVAELEELAFINGNAYLHIADVLEIVRGKE